MGFWLFNCLKLIILIWCNFQLSHQLICERKFMPPPFFPTRLSAYSGLPRYISCQNVNSRIDIQQGPYYVERMWTNLVISNSTLIELKSDLFNNSLVASIENLKIDANVEIINNDTFKNFNLATLSLRNNQIKRLNNSLIYLKKLEVLDLSFNKIISLEDDSFINFRTLQNLYLSNNYLERLPNLTIKTLISLDVNNNRLESIPDNIFNNLTNLEILLLGNNKLNKLPINLLNQNQNLTKLDLSQNRLVDFNLTLPNSCQILNLSQNFIENFNFAQFPALEIIDLSRNNLKVILKPLESTEVEKLYLNYNKLRKIGDLRNFKNLEFLDLSNNQILEIDNDAFSTNNKLNKLDLSNNNINNLYIDKFPISLQQLNLNDNNLNKIDNFSHLINLRDLDLSSNQIHEIPLNSLTMNLQNLKLNNNKIETLQLGCFKNLQSLRSLDLSFNSIEILPLGIFGNLKTIEILNLSHNQLKHLASGIFFSSKTIEYFDISFNNFDYIDIENLLPSFPSKSVIDLTGNNWSCSVLVEIIKKFKNLNFKDGNQHDVTNINGIACNDNDGITNNKLDNDLILLQNLNNKMLIIVILLLLIILLFIGQLFVKYSLKDLINNHNSKFNVSEQELTLIN